MDFTGDAVGATSAHWGSGAGGEVSAYAGRAERGGVVGEGVVAVLMFQPYRLKAY